MQHRGGATTVGALEVGLAVDDLGSLILGLGWDYASFQRDRPASQRKDDEDAGYAEPALAKTNPVHVAPH